MADRDVEQIRVEILSIAQQFRADMDANIKKLGQFGGAVGAVPDSIDVGVEVDDTNAMRKLGQLDAAIKGVPDATVGVKFDDSAARTALAAFHSAVAGSLESHLGSAVVGGSSTPVGRGGPAVVYGVRQRTDRIATADNPFVIAIEAPARTGLGGLAAQIGERTAGGLEERPAATVLSEADRSALVYAMQKAARPQGVSMVRQLVAEGHGEEVAPMLAEARGGGGGGGGLGTFLSGAAAGGGDRGGGGVLRRLLLGGGGMLAGTAAIGSLGSFAGLGAEHPATTAAGIVGSAGGAAIGGGLLAAGAAGQLAVGGGSDLAVMKSTIADTQQLYKNYHELEHAVLKYGAGSRQAKEAQAALNATFAELGNTAGVQAEAGLARQAAALNRFWDEATSNARIQAVRILEQVVTLGRDFVPKVAHAAEQNLGIINRSIRPLFAWLEGPEGMRIFDELEQRFAAQLPTAVHAFSQAIELVIRIVDIASQYTGGFIGGLDRLATRLNSVDSAKLDQWVQHMVGIFRVWETLIKLVIQDVALLFKADVGTGTAIIKALDGMLLRLREWERSTVGQAQLKNIFAVHREEILALLALLPPLLGAFGKIYMAIAPTLVNAVTTLTKAMLPLVEALAYVAEHSKAVALAFGLMFIAWRAGQLGNIISGIKSLTVAETAGAGAAAADAAAQGSLAGAEGAAGAGAGGGLLSRIGGLGGGAIGSFARGALPVAGAFVGSNLVANMAGLHGFGKGALEGATTGAAAGFVAGGPLGALIGGGVGGVAGTTLGLIGEHKTVEIKSLGEASKRSAAELEKLANAMEKAGSVKMAGIQQNNQVLAEQVRHLAEAKNAWNSSFDAAYRAVHNFSVASGPMLHELYDRFNTNMRLISSTMGLNSAQGRKLAEDNTRQMVSHMAEAITQGKVPIGTGMQAIQNVVNSYSASTGDDTTKIYKSLFAELGSLYSQHKITAQVFWGAVQTTASRDTRAIKDETTANYNTTMSNLAAALHRGEITSDTYHKDEKTAQENANRETQRRMGQLSETIISHMGLTAQTSAKAIENIDHNLNAVLGSLGAPKIPEAKLVQFIAQHAVTGVSGAAHAARGALVQYGNTGEKGRDSIPTMIGGVPLMVGAGEMGAVLTGEQQDVANAYLAPIGGLGGLFANANTPHYMAQGGAVGAMMAEANRINAAHYPYVWGGGHGSFAGPYDCSGAVSAVLHAGGFLGRAEVSGELMGFGAPGPGAVSIWASPAHTFMSLDGRFFGTHGAEGAGWYAGSSLPGYAIRHVPLAPGEGGLGMVPLPHVDGKGPLANMVRGVISNAGKGANAYLQAHATFGGESSGPGSAHGTFTKAMLEALWRQGGGDPSVAHLMAAIALAESAGNPQSHNASGASGLWQILGVPFPGNVFDPLTNARMAVSKYKSQGLGAWVTYSSGAYRKFMAAGGLLRGASTGYQSSPHVLSSVPQRAKALPKGAARHARTHVPLARVLGAPTQAVLAGPHGLNTMLEVTIPTLQERYSVESGADELGMRAMPYSGEFLISSSEPGVKPFIEWGNVDARRGQLAALGNWQEQIKADLEGALKITEPMLAWAERAKVVWEAKIARLNREIKALKHKLQERLRHLRERINHNLGRIRVLEGGERRAKGTELMKIRGEIHALHAENLRLGGSASSVGEGGLLHSAQLAGEHQQKAAENHLGSLSKELEEIKLVEGKASEDRRSIRGLGGTGGLLGETRHTLTELGLQASEIGDNTLATKLKQALAQTGPSAQETELTAVLKEQNEKLSQQAAISNAQFAVFKGFLPMLQGRLVGSFASGSDFVSQTGLALVHRGEQIVPDPEGAWGRQTAGVQPAPVIEVHLAKTDGLVQVIDARINSRALPVTSVQSGQRSRLMAGVTRG